jgi:hypothetical protein
MVALHSCNMISIQGQLSLVRWLISAKYEMLYVCSTICGFGLIFYNVPFKLWLDSLLEHKEMHPER